MRLTELLTMIQIARKAIRTDVSTWISLKRKGVAGEVYVAHTGVLMTKIKGREVPYKATIESLLSDDWYVGNAYLDFITEVDHGEENIQ